MPAKLMLVNVPTTDFERSLPFYAALLGVEQFVENKHAVVQQYYTPLGSDGSDLAVTAKQEARETTVAYFAVDDLQGTVERLKRAGGEVVLPPTEMPEEGKREGDVDFGNADLDRPPDFGALVMMVDPDGNYVGLVQLAPEPARYFGLTDEHEKQLAERREEVLRSAG